MRLSALISAALDRYAARNANDVPVVPSHSGPRRAQRGKQTQPTSQGLGLGTNGLSRASLWLVLSLTSFAGAAPQQPAPPAPAPPAPGPRTIVTYVEVQPDAEAQAIPILKGYRDATRRAAGNLGAQVWQRVGPRGHFAVVEEWKDEESWKAHRGSAHVAQFHDKLTPLRTSSYDERNHTNFDVAPSSMPPGDAVLVVTHIDITPPGLPKALEILKAEPGMTRTETGNIRFDLLRGMRQNHFTVLEAWRDERAREAHVAAAHTKAYREGLREQAIDGAPYDERLYRLVQ